MCNVAKFVHMWYSLACGKCVLCPNKWTYLATGDISEKNMALTCYKRRAMFYVSMCNIHYMIVVSEILHVNMTHTCCYCDKRHIMSRYCYCYKQHVYIAWRLYTCSFSVMFIFCIKYIAILYTYVVKGHSCRFYPFVCGNVKGVYPFWVLCVMHASLSSCVCVCVFISSSLVSSHFDRTYV